MSAERLLPWQEDVWQMLAAYVAQQRIPQALLISGVDGLGKDRLAQGFAQALFCAARQSDNQACGRCQHCHLFLAQTYPDWIIVQPEEPGKAIGVDQIRTLLGKLTLKPQFAGQRVVLVRHAEQLNRAAANAFLKGLEEPSERTSILLVTAKPYLLPATIRSRCQHIQLAVPPHELAMSWLLAQPVAAEDAGNLLQLAHGAPLLALDYAQRQLPVTHRQCLADWLGVAGRRQEPSGVAEAWAKLNTAEVLAWVTRWTVDIIRCHANTDYAKLHNSEPPPSLQSLAPALDPRGVFRFYDLLLCCQRQLPTTTNKQVMFEEILVRWSQLNGAKIYE